MLTGSVSVTAKDHTAPISLGRGGTVRVCQTTVLHLTREHRRRLVRRAAAVLARPRSHRDPDQRHAERCHHDPRSALHRAQRRARSICACGSPATATPAWTIAARTRPRWPSPTPSANAMYELAPGQHVLFEHGSLREVVDHETSPCGCPDEKGMSVADALLIAPITTSAPKTPPPPPAPQPAPQVPPPVVVSVAPPVTPVAAPPVQPAVPAASATPAQVAVSSAPHLLVVAPAAAPALAPAAPPVIPQQAVEHADHCMEQPLAVRSHEYVAGTRLVLTRRNRIFRSIPWGSGLSAAVPLSQSPRIAARDR